MSFKSHKYWTQIELGSLHQEVQKQKHSGQINWDSIATKLGRTACGCKQKWISRGQWNYNPEAEEDNIWEEPRKKLRVERDENTLKKPLKHLKVDSDEEGENLWEEPRKKLKVERDEKPLKHLKVDSEEEGENLREEPPKQLKIEHKRQREVTQGNEKKEYQSKDKSEVQQDQDLLNGIKMIKDKLESMIVAKKKTYRIIVVGDIGVGKSSYLMALEDNIPKGYNYRTELTTIGNVEVQALIKHKVIFDFVDIDINWRGWKVIEKDYVGAHGAIVMFDPSRPITIENAKAYQNRIEIVCGKGIPIAMVSSKADLGVRVDFDCFRVSTAWMTDKSKLEKSGILKPMDYIMKRLMRKKYEKKDE